MENYAKINLPFSSLQGLTRTASFSELPTANRRIIVEESDSTGGLIKQYSYEQIFIKDTNNIKKIQYSTIIKTENKSRGLDIWKKNIPRYNSASNIAWPPRNFPQENKAIMNTGHKEKEKKNGGKLCEFPNLTFDSLKISDDKSPIKFNPVFQSMGNMDLSGNLMKTEAKPNFDGENLNRRAFSHVENKSENVISHRKINDSPKNSLKKNSSTDCLNSSGLNRQSVDTSELKKNIRPLVLREEVSPNTGKTRIKWFKAGCLILVTVIAVIAANLKTENQQKPFDFKNASLELEQKIFGQEDAIAQLTNHFNENIDEFTVVVLIGGTGVGKSYAKKIIKNHFPHQESIFEYIPPLHDFFRSANYALSHLHCNLVILENLKTDDIPDLVEFTKFIYHQENKFCAVVLALLNPESIDEEFVRSVDLRSHIEPMEFLFQKEDIPVKMVVFKPLGEEIIDICIKEAAKDLDIELTHEQFEVIQKSLVRENSGCKRAYSKVQLYTRS